MSVIRRVSVSVGQTVPVIPPDEVDRDAEIQWTIVNPSGSGGAVELLDDATKTLGGGLVLAAGAAPWQSLGRNEHVWAAGPASGSPVVIVVTGTAYGD